MVRLVRAYPEDYVPKSVGDEVDWLVSQWYASLGQSIPVEELGAGAMIDEMERRRFDEMFQSLNETPKEVFQADVKPEFGTPAFWAWAHKQRAQKNKERAEQGLPPLPTKKEKEAAKEARAKERSAAKLAKVAKALEKLTLSEAKLNKSK